MQRDKLSRPTTSRRAGQFTRAGDRSGDAAELRWRRLGHAELHGDTTSRAALAGQTPNAHRARCRRLGQGRWNYDTIELAFNKRFQKGLFLDTSFDWTRRDDLEPANSASNNPLTQSDVISVAQDYFQNAVSDGVEPADDDQLGVPPVEPVRAAVPDRRRRELPGPERLAVRAAASPSSLPNAGTQ